MLNKRLARVYLLALVSIAALFITLETAHAAASLYVAPPSGTFTIGSTFTVSIFVDTGGQSINAVDAELSFPPDKLQVVSPTTGKSMIQIWVVQPTYSNAAGTLSFQGAIPTPGLQTSAGLISTVTFRVNNIGTAALKILDSSHVLLNDGRGTDILGQTTSGVYYLTLPPPEGPIVISRTHPDQEKWYGENTVVFEWNAPPDVQGYSYVLDQNPASEPDDVSEGVKTRVVYNNLADGTYYFHIKGLRQGSWGGVTDYVVHLDTTPPAAFNINISPSNYTSSQRPIIDFGTTDAVSGIDHYELKLIPLDLPLAKTGQAETPFFIEVNPPYSPKLDYGHYDVVVRAYDAAGNYYQAEKRLTVSPSLFELISDEGLRIGDLVLGWPLTIILVLALFVALGWASRFAWFWHLRVEEELREGALRHPRIAEKMKDLTSKLKEYGHSTKDYDKRGGRAGLLVVFAVVIIVLGVVFLPLRRSYSENAVQNAVNPGQADAAPQSNVELQPPVVTLFPSAISNDEILYIGGKSSIPNAIVVIYLQNTETGNTLSESATTNKDGAWFYSFPQFLSAGHYLVWTQLQLRGVTSPPSPQFDLTVAPAAIQIGGSRLSYQDFFFILAIIFGLAFAALTAFTVYHTYHFRVKSRKLAAAIAEAEDSLRRGFALLRRDIESELNVIRKAKLSKEISVEEKFREEKLLKDLDYVSRFLGREIWEVEEEEKKL